MLLGVQDLQEMPDNKKIQDHQEIGACGSCNSCNCCDSDSGLKYSKTFFDGKVLSEIKKRQKSGPKPRLEIINRINNEGSIREAAFSTGLDPGTIRLCRKFRSAMTSHAEEKEWLWKTLRASLELNPVSLLREICFKLHNHAVVTKKQFLGAYGLDRRRVEKLMTRASDPRVLNASPPKVPALPRGLRYSTTELMMAAFLYAFVSLYSDEQPNNKQRHLDPTAFRELWNSYQLSCIYRGCRERMGTETLLSSVWKHRFLYANRVHIRRNKGVRGGQCYECTLLKFMAERVTSHEDEMAYVAAAVEHRSFHGTERELQYTRMYKAEVNPEEIDVIFCDIWDISKNLVPWSKFGSVDGAFGDTDTNVIRNRIQGIMYHGKTPMLYLYKSLPLVRKGADLTCTQIMDSICRRGTGLAPTVSFEVDGGSENQNKTVIALCADLLVRKCTKMITLVRLPIHHTHNILDGYFGQLSQSTKGKVSATRHIMGVGSRSQQDWDKAAQSTLRTVDVKVVDTRALYDFTGHYKNCIDPKFVGFGPGTPIRVMQLFLGPPTQMFPEGEPLMRYKLAAQYENWYPDDPEYNKEGAPMFRYRPPASLPPLKELEDWEELEQVRANIINDSQNRHFFEERHHQEWKDWFAVVLRQVKKLEATDLPLLQFPASREITKKVSTHVPRHAEKKLSVEEQPLMWSNHEKRVGALKTKPRNKLIPKTKGKTTKGAKGKSTQKTTKGGKQEGKSTVTVAVGTVVGTVVGTPMIESSISGGNKRKRKPTLPQWDTSHNCLCEICSLGGSLVCCYSCNCVFHRSCYESLKATKRIGKYWQCVECLREEEPEHDKDSNSEGEQQQEEPNEYMQMIAANIARNKKKLQQLGLGSDQKMAKKTKTTGTGEIKYTAANRRNRLPCRHQSAETMVFSGEQALAAFPSISPTSKSFFTDYRS